MCFDVGIVTCGPNEALVVSGMGYGEQVPALMEGLLSTNTCVYLMPPVYLALRSVQVEVEGQKELEYRPHVVIGEHQGSVIH